MSDQHETRQDIGVEIHNLELDRINLAAERLNVEVLDVLDYQVSLEDIDMSF